jgi:hypothetical protein
MSIRTFIQSQILLPRLQQHEVLVVYDAEQRYRELCLELASDTLRVVDAGESSIESRAAALAALQELGAGSDLQGLLVYVPARAPLSDEEHQRDPFALYAACGALFPAHDGDEYLSLCLRARPDYATTIRQIFANDPNPAFEVIDAVGGGAGWPQLQAVLGEESARGILFRLLAPGAQHLEALKGQEAWLAEAKTLFANTLGLKLLTRAKTVGPVTDELWRFLLFSEFVFDLPGELPAALQQVPCAQPEARPLVEDLCERLRNDSRTQALYIERAETIEQELQLPSACAGISDLGVRDTFPFEERTFFRRAVDALLRTNLEALNEALARHDNSVWAGRGENRVQWQLLRASATLLEVCADAGQRLAKQSGSLDALIDFYLNHMRDVDRYQRECEEAAGDYLALDETLEAVLGQARKSYRQLADKVQQVFLQQVAQSGWPPGGRLANVDVFDQVVAPLLQQSGRRVALLLIDALRYELGIELHKQLAEDNQTAVQAAFAPVPSVTPVGMAGLLPGAGQQLRLQRKDNQVAVLLGEQSLSTVSQRMDVLRRRYGERFAETSLDDFVQKKTRLPAGAELLVIRSNEMDSQFENNPDTAPSLISRTFQRVVMAIRRLRDLDFQEAVIVTDHGFFLNPAVSAGDTCARPEGAWITLHGRILLGAGAGDAANAIFDAAALGIRSDFAQVAVPRAMVAYRSNSVYLHGGLSLQETVVPVISVQLAPVAPAVSTMPTVTLQYKRGARRVTSRFVVIDLDIGAGDLFSQDKSFEILLEAQTRKGEVVGEARPGGPVNAATRTITVQPGDNPRITLKMDEDYEGKFVVKALDPQTMTTYASLELETDYTV